jgi:hypothetical protein
MTLSTASPTAVPMVLPIASSTLFHEWHRRLQVLLLHWQQVLLLHQQHCWLQVLLLYQRYCWHFSKGYCSISTDEQSTRPTTKLWHCHTATNMHTDTSEDMVVASWTPVVTTHPILIFQATIDDLVIMVFVFVIIILVTIIPTELSHCHSDSPSMMHPDDVAVVITRATILFL